MQIQQHQQKQQNNIFLLPGQNIQSDDQTLQNSKINTNAFRYKNQKIISKYSGYFLQKKSNVQNKKILTMLLNGKTYTPQINDYVVGVVKSKGQQFYYVDINANNDAHLGAYQFNGATKRNKPNLNLGSCVFCQVKTNEKFLAPEITCKTNQKKQWVTGQTKLGQLKKGNVLFLQPQRHKYLEKKLQIFSKFVSFQIALGKNGYIWLNTKKIKNLILLSNLIQMINKGDIDQVLANLGDLIQK